MELPFLQAVAKPIGGQSAQEKSARHPQDAEQSNDDFDATYKAERQSAEKDEDRHAPGDAATTESGSDPKDKEVLPIRAADHTVTDVSEPRVDTEDDLSFAQGDGEILAGASESSSGMPADSQKKKSMTTAELSETIFRQQVVSEGAQEARPAKEKSLARTVAAKGVTSSTSAASDTEGMTNGPAGSVTGKAVAAETEELAASARSETQLKSQGDKARFAASGDVQQPYRPAQEMAGVPRLGKGVDEARTLRIGVPERGDPRERRLERSEQFHEVVGRRDAPASVPQKSQVTAQPALFGLQAQDQKSSAVKETGPFDLLKVDGVDAEFSSVKDVRTANTAALNQVLARGETPAMIGRQMAEALHRMPDQPVQLTLSPKELGKVKMSISAGEQGITVSVIAERQETLDLMRRNANDLAKEFHNMGYAAVNFAFSEGRSGEGQMSSDQNGQGGSSQIEQIENAETSVPNIINMVPSDGLDLRL